MEPKDPIVWRIVGVNVVAWVGAGIGVAVSPKFGGGIGWLLDRHIGNGRGQRSVNPLLHFDNPSGPLPGDTSEYDGRYFV